MDLGHGRKQNVNPTIIATKQSTESRLDGAISEIGQERDPINAEEVFELIRTINDPEHPLTLEQLKVVSLEQVEANDEKSFVKVLFTPTIMYCSMATLIGLCITTKLQRSLPTRFKSTVQIAPGKHSSESAVNKQLADKERVAAALENSHLMAVVNKCISPGDPSLMHKVVAE